MSQVKAYRQQANDAESERQNLQNQLKQLENNLQMMIRNGPKKPRLSLEQIDQEIKKLEFKRSTTTMSLQDEKMLIKQIEKLKSDKKIFDSFDDFEEKLEVVRREQRAIRNKLNNNRSALRQFKSQAHEYGIAERISQLKGGVPISPDIVTDLEVEINPERIGLIVGKQGASLKKLEELYAVVIDIEKSRNVAIIRGVAGDTAAAKAAIAAINDETTKEMKLTTAQVHLLKRNKGKYIKAIEEILQVSMHIRDGKDRENASTLMIRGDKEKVTSAGSMILQLANYSTTLHVPSEVFSAIIGTNGETIGRIQDEHFVSIELKRDTNSLDVAGSEAQVSAAVFDLRQIIEENEHIKVEIPLDSAGIGASIIGKGGETVRNIEKETGSIVKVTTNGEHPKVVISAPKSKITEAELAIRKVLETYLKLHKSVFCSEAHGGFCFNKFSPLQKYKDSISPDTIINVQRQGNQIKISIRSEDEVNVINAVNEINALLAKQTSKTIPVDKAAVSAIIGKSGKTISQLQEDTETSIHVDKSTLVVQGEMEGILKVEERLKEILQHHIDTNKSISVISDLLGMIIGKGGAKLKQVREASGARIDVQRLRPADQANAEFLKAASSNGKGFIVQVADVATVKVSGDEVEQVAKGLEMVKNLAGEALVHDENRHLLNTAYVPIPHPESCGFLLGAKGLKVKGLESTHNVTIEVLQKDDKVSIRGKDILSCETSNLERVAVTVKSLLEKGIPKEETVFVNANVIALLKGRETKNIQVETGAKLSIQDDNTVLVSGTSFAVDNAVSILSDMVKNIRRDRVRVEKEHMETLLKNGSRNVRRLENQAGCAIILDELHNMVRIRGLTKHIEDGKEGIRQLLKYYHADHFSMITVPSDAIPSIIGKKGANVRKVQEENKVVVNIIKHKNIVEVVGTDSDAVQAATMDIKNMLEEWKCENKEVHIPEEIIPAFIGRGGAGIKQFEKEYKGISVNVDREGSLVRIRGSNEEELEKVLVMVTEQIKKLTDEAQNRYDEPVGTHVPGNKTVDSKVYSFVQDDSPQDAFDNVPVHNFVESTTSEQAQPRKCNAYGSIIGESKTALKNKRRRERKRLEKLGESGLDPQQEESKESPEVCEEQVEHVTVPQPVQLLRPPANHAVPTPIPKLAAPVRPSEILGQTAPPGFSTISKPNFSAAHETVAPTNDATSVTNLWSDLLPPPGFGDQNSKDSSENAPYYMGSGGYTVRLS